MTAAMRTMDKLISALSRDVLEHHMRRILQELFVEEEDGVEWIDPDKDWSPDTIDGIRDCLPEVIQRHIEHQRNKPLPLEVQQPFYQLGFEYWQTGGGCTALHRAVAGDQYIMVTDDSALAPDADTTKWCVGVYKDADQLEYQAWATKEAAIEYCKALIDKYGGKQALVPEASES